MLGTQVEIDPITINDTDNSTQQIDGAFFDDDDDFSSESQHMYFSTGMDLSTSQLYDPKDDFNKSTDSPWKQLPLWNPNKRCVADFGLEVGLVIVECSTELANVEWLCTIPDPDNSTDDVTTTTMMPETTTTTTTIAPTKRPGSPGGISTPNGNVVVKMSVNQKTDVNVNNKGQGFREYQGRSNQHS